MNYKHEYKYCTYVDYRLLGNVFRITIESNNRKRTRVNQVVQESINISFCWFSGEHFLQNFLSTRASSIKRKGRKKKE